MKRHSWSRNGEGIYQCTRCGLYRCHALTDYTEHYVTDGRRRMVDVEYSGVRGDVIALNPISQPPCVGDIYV